MIMKLTELISDAQNYLDKYGDLEVELCYLSSEYQIDESCSIRGDEPVEVFESLDHVTVSEYTDDQEINHETFVLCAGGIE